LPSSLLSSRKLAILSALSEAGDPKAAKALLTVADGVASLVAKADDAKPSRRRRPVAKAASEADVLAAVGGQSAKWAEKVVCDAVLMQIAGESRRSIGPMTKEIVEGLKELEPRDIIDGMLSTLMIGCYQEAMSSLTIARSMNDNGYLSPSRTVNLAQAGQLARTFAQLIETRDKRRAGNSHPAATVHKVIVSHVVEGREAAAP
jgi:hypothetical protein